MVTTLKLYNPRESDLASSWHVIDASDQTLGRLATRAAMLIMGKHKPRTKSIVRSRAVAVCCKTVCCKTVGARIVAVACIVSLE